MSDPEQNSIPKLESETPGSGDVAGLVGQLVVDEAEFVEDVDHESLVTRDSLLCQLIPAIGGYDRVANSLNGGRRRKHQAKVHEAASIKTAFEAWLTPDKLMLVNQMIEGMPGARVTLVATPNVLADAEEIIAVAKRLSIGQPRPTQISEALVSQYIPEQLSGTTEHNDSLVNFVLIPSERTPGLDRTVSGQRGKLLEALESGTDCLRVPSVLDAITYWATLRAQGQRLADDIKVFDLTYIRHFDLNSNQLGGMEEVPATFIGGDGAMHIAGSYVDDSQRGRLAVGRKTLNIV